MHKVAFVVEYDGTKFHGFQIQPELRTVQGVLQEVLSRVENRNITLEFASRTDAGVHAYYQVVSFISYRDIVPRKWLTIMRGLLPEDVRVWKVAYVPLDFHPQFTPHEKEYIYRLSRCPLSVFERKRAWWVNGLDVDKMREEIKYIVGVHDFVYFSKQGAPRKNTVRDLRVTLTEKGKYVILSFRSSGFLYGMVRLIVGTLVGVAIGKLPVGATQRVLGGDLSVRGKSAPPWALFLNNIIYNTMEIEWQEECDGYEDDNT